MEKKLSPMGVGGKIALVLVASVAVTECASLLLAPMFRIARDAESLVPAALAMACAGFAINLVAAFEMLAAYKKDRLATGGLYALCLNPMYAFQLLLTVPGLLLLLNSWLNLLAMIPAFIAFKAYAREEERYLAGKFGKEYERYREKVLLKFL